MDTDDNASNRRANRLPPDADTTNIRLIERLECAIDSDRQLAAALRGAAAALEDAASRYEALADATDPDAPSATFVNDPGHRRRDRVVRRLHPQARARGSLADLAEGTAAEEPCVACGQVLIDIAAGNSMTADPYEQTRRPLDRIRRQPSSSAAGRISPTRSPAITIRQPRKQPHQTDADQEHRSHAHPHPVPALTPTASSALFGTSPPKAGYEPSTTPPSRPTPTSHRKLFEQDALERLAESIRARGLLQPLIVRETETRKLPDHRRRAALARPRHHRSRDRRRSRQRNQDDATALQDALIENVVREDLTRSRRAAGTRA